MNFQILNLNLNQKEIKKEFFKPYGQQAETARSPARAGALGLPQPDHRTRMA
jgi:hypothetical protein